jgi:hypothetical protein
MSTIIRFSARSFSERLSAVASASSCSAVAPRAAVPFIGRVRSSPDSRSKKSSGEAETIAKRPRSTYAAWRGRWAAIRSWSRASRAACDAASSAGRHVTSGGGPAGAFGHGVSHGASKTPSQTSGVPSGSGGSVASPNAAAAS